MILAEYIAERLKMPFQYGVNDCVLFAVGWVEMVSGKKYLPEIIWNNKTEAMRIVSEMGGLEAAFDRHFIRVNPSFAQDGDLAIYKKTATLFSGSNIVSVGESGLIFLNRLLAETAWRSK